MGADILCVQDRVRSVLNSSRSKHFLGVLTVLRGIMEEARRSYRTTSSAINARIASEKMSADFGNDIEKTC